MSLLGIHLTMLIGPTVAVPAPLPLMEALESVNVSHQDQGTSGFQITFQVGRSGPADLLDYGLLTNPLLRPFNRVVIIVTFNAIPRVLMDGFITHQQLSPGTEPGAARLTVTGEDVSVMMDLKGVTAEHPVMPENLAAFTILLKYMQYLGLPPITIPPPSLDPPLPIQRTPVQQGTDRAYLKQMAGRFGYVFYVKPGPIPLTNIAYWGPPERIGVPQRALSANMGPETNVESISFQYNALAPTTVSGKVQDPDLNVTLPIQTFASLRPPLASQPALLVNQPNVRNTDIGTLQSRGEPGATEEERFNLLGVKYVSALARAQGTTDRSTDNVLTASGELDALHYGDLLQPRGLVGLRGVGYNHDGLYYVKSVSHAIRKGEYKQRFTLTREGHGSLVPAVIP
jgi:hypothetical protein